MKKISFPITVFYDGSCSVCAEEMAHYRKMDRHGRLVMVDISDETFNPAQYGKTLQEEFETQMHVQDGDGSYFLGVDAFPAIWQALPGRLYRLLSILVMLPGIHGLTKTAYALFAKYRKRLFPSTTTCDSGQCGIGHHR